MTEPIDWEDEEHFRLVAGWIRAADENPPHPKNWHVFVGRLRRAAEDFRHVGASEDSQLALIRDVAVAATDFMGGEVALADPQVRASLMPLLRAIADVQQGRRPSLFNPPRLPKRPPLSVAQANTAGAAAKALTELMNSGTSVNAASEKVSRAVRSGRCAGFEKCRGATVRGWRNRIHEGEGSISTFAIKQYHSALPPHVSELSASERARFILDSLRYGEGFR